jgi:hypothetical protein
MDPEPGVPGTALADATGTLTVSGLEAALASGHPYARSLGRFGPLQTLRPTPQRIQEQLGGYS